MKKELLDNPNKGTSCKGRTISRRDYFIITTVVLGLFIILAVFLTACTPPKKEKGPGVPGVNEVWLIGWVYEPETITVPVGTTVSWNNTTRDYHTVTSDDGLFDSRLGGGQSFNYTFTKPGIFTYQDIATDPPTIGKVVVK